MTDGEGDWRRVDAALSRGRGRGSRWVHRPALLVVVAVAVLGLIGGAARSQSLDEKGYRRAVAPREWSFPRDHGRHDGFKTEWWYFTGHLRDASGRRFGYQFTIFRSALTPRPTTRPSAFAATDLYILHVAVSDFAGKRFLTADRLMRGRQGVAFAADDTLDVALLDASAKVEGDGVRIRAAEKDFSFDFTATPTRAPTLQGPGGLNPKGPAEGQASYYYSWTRLKTAGKLTVGGRTLDVNGQSWMDHEFSSNPLSDTQAGWDWISLHLTDGSDLMVYRLRDKDGRTDFLSGSRTSPDGAVTYLKAADLRVEPGEPWTSDRTGIAYPLRWTIAVAGGPPITVRAIMPGQEWQTPDTTNIDYFEGGVDALDEKGNAIGAGYLEMTGSVKTMAGG